MRTWEYSAQLVRVIDGDTIRVRLDLGFYLTVEVDIRIKGVNCPELHGPTAEAGKVAKDFTLAELGHLPAFMVRSYKADKYGNRWDGDVLYATGHADIDYLRKHGTDLGTRLLETKNAVPFMVGKT